MKCFLSCSFHDNDARVIDWFRDFVSAFPDVQVIEGRYTAKPSVETIVACVDECDFVCPVFTTRGRSVPAWLHTELGMAAHAGKPIVAFVEIGIPKKELAPLSKITEYQKFDRNLLGLQAPGYLRAIYDARVSVLKANNEDRASLLKAIETLDAFINRSFDT